LHRDGDGDRTDAYSSVIATITLVIRHHSVDSATGNDEDDGDNNEMYRVARKTTLKRKRSVASISGARGDAPPQ